jgi:cytochrome c-type biogenesis protein
MISTLLLAFLAGLLTIFSPCVLPILPLTLGAASAQGRLGPLYLALGLNLSFVAIGMFVALIGFSIGLDEGVFRAIAALMMIAVGFILAVPALQTRVAMAAGPASGWVNQRFSGNLNAILGMLLVASGILIILGWDKLIESRLIEFSPDWLTELTTRF